MERHFNPEINCEHKGNFSDCENLDTIRRWVNSVPLMHGLALQADPKALKCVEGSNFIRLYADPLWRTTLIPASEKLYAMSIESIFFNSTQGIQF